MTVPLYARFTRDLVRDFARDRRGVAAMEFAMVFPIFLILMLGTFEITSAVIGHKKAQKLAYTVDALLTKTPNLNLEAVTRTLRATTHMMIPFDPAALTIEVSYQYVDEHGSVSERWGQRLSEGSVAKVTPTALPEEFLAIREAGYLATRVHYDHPATFPSLFFETIPLNAEAIVRPRPGVALSCSDC